MESKTNYTLIGIAVLLLAAGLLFSLLWLSVGFERKKYTTYVVYIHESAGGLTEDSPIKFNGVKVGSINKIELSKIDPQNIKLLLNIEAGTLITTHTKATLITQGITGTTYLGLTATSPTLSPLLKQPNEPYPVIPYTASFFNRMEKVVSTMSTGLNRVFDKENTQYFKDILASLQKISATIAQNNDNINKSLRDLPEVLRELKITVHQVSLTAKALSTASHQVTETMRAGKDGIDQIAQQAIPPTTLLLKRLDVIAANLEHVSALMRSNPAVILRGTAPLKSGPGE